MEMVMERTMIKAETMALRAGADLMPRKMRSFSNQATKPKIVVTPVGDEAEEQAGAVHGHHCGHADDLAHGEGWEWWRRPSTEGINALPAEKHKHGE